jgi:tRNA modification GTPase
MMQQFTGWDDTIAAIATAPGLGAIGVIRLSGKNAVPIINQLFTSKDLSKQPTHTLHVGFIKNDGVAVDEVVVSLYKNPKSYTGEDVVEISCHGSPYVQQQVLQACLQKGARLAKPGEFTQRAFLNGKLDLTQAEAVGDLIASETESVHQTALQQMKGGFSNDIKQLREQLINFAALIELELDFGEEDVEFADREKLHHLIDEILVAVKKLIHSFKLGNIIKNGVTAVIAGRPNAGKSTLLNAMLNEERAIVTEIAGTTRDTIEEKLVVDGIVFRLIDTAGIREATDIVEKIGIEKSLEKIETASVLIYVFDAANATAAEVKEDINRLKKPAQQLLLVANKTDKISTATVKHFEGEITVADNSISFFEVSALNKTRVDELISFLPSLVLSEKINTNQTIVVNSRHFAALSDCEKWLLKVKEGLHNNISGDLLALDIRQALLALAEITGEILHDRDILGTIFGKFCIGK